MDDAMTEAGRSRRATAADLEMCAREPIHIPGAIQPFGILLLVGTGDYVIRAASRNVEQIWEWSARSMIGRSIGELFDGATSKRLMDWLTTTPERPATAAEFSVQLPGGERHYRPVAHQVKDGWILELEQKSAHSPESIAGVLHRAIDRLQDAPSLESLTTAAADEVRAVTGFDSVMIYQFDDEWNGAVVAQSRADHMASYTGHHFPASDIPKQARRLYTMNLSRLIVNIDYEPILIESDGAGGEPIDLTHSVLRSVSPVHLEYLHHMGVRASMSISIVADGRLWGLIACHHASPRHVSIDTRVACELLARVMSMLVVNLREIQGQTHSARLAAVHNSLLEAMLRQDDFADGLVEEQDALLELAGASGAAIIRGGTCTLLGQTPPGPRVMGIASWLVDTQRNEETFASEALATDYPEASDLSATAAGLLAVPLSTFDASFLMWFRPELPRSIDWAGEPDKAVRVEDEGEWRIRPRRSFATWTEIQRGRSRPWLPAERKAAGALRAAVTDVVVSRTEEVRRLNGSLGEVNRELLQRNRELRDITDITTHDLQEPLRKIRAFADLLQREENSALSSDGLMYLDRLAAAAERMSALVYDMRSFSSVLVETPPLTPVDLNAELRAALEELRQLGFLDEAEIEADDLPAVEGDPNQMRQLFRNVIENAVKFRHPDRAPRVTVRCSRRDDRPAVFRIIVADNGLGIADNYLASIFEPFHQLHRRGRFEGTGMGLAVCRRIVERHGGSIAAESELGVGTRILIDLPGAS